MLKNKRGLSAVLVTVLIVLIGMIAVGITWYAIRGGIEGGLNQAGAQQKCLGLNLKIEDVIYKYNSSALNAANWTEVKVRRDADTSDFNLTAIKIVVNGKVNESSSVPDELGYKVYTIFGNDVATEVSVAGVIGDTTCAISDRVDSSKIKKVEVF